MEQESEFCMRKGFTLIEMLVVIAIIGILAAIVVPLSSDAIRTARESTCRNNLKNLQVAAVNYANDHGGQLPRAGSFEVADHTGRWWERRGWISWIHTGSIGGYVEGTKQSQIDRMEDGWEVGCESGKFKADRAMFAITNGTLFAYTGEDLGLYVCPEAAKASGFNVFGKRKGFSTYVMNGFFHYEVCKDHRWNDPRHLSRMGTASETICDNFDSSNRGFRGFSPEAANILLFAEHSGVKPPDNRKPSSAGYGSLNGKTNNGSSDGFKIGHNCVLDTPFKDPDKSPTTFIGTYHGKRNSLGMVIFLDGHITAEHKSTEVGEVKNIAYWLCRGESPENE